MSTFAEHIVTQLAPLGGVTTRKMFGALCVFRDGAVFGIVDDGQLFLKVDAALRAEWVAEGGTPFTYPHKEGHRVEMAYCTPPSIDDPEALLASARRSLQIARAKASTKKASTKKASTKKAPSTKKASSTKKAPSKKASSAKKASTKKAPSKKKASSKKKAKKPR